MKGDKIQTFFLITLVLLSLVLTFFLWYGTAYYEDTEIVFQEDFYFEEPRKEISTIVPSEIVLPLPDNEFVVCRKGTDDYHKIWEKTISLLSGSYIDEISENDTIPMETPSLIFYFDPLIPLQSIEGLPGTIISDMDKMYLFIYESESVAVLRSEEKVMLIKFNDELLSDELANILNKALNNNTMTYCLLISEKDTSMWDFDFSVSGDIYLPCDDLYMNSNITLVREKIPTDDLLKAFFVNKKLARRIEGPDGTLIFTDGEKGLRIWEYVEYTAPRLEKGSATYSYRSAVQKANEYICYYGGWPEKLYLEDIYLNNFTGANSIGKCYFARWVFYHEGFPVIGRGGGIDIKFNDQGLYYYNRSLLVPSINSKEKIRVTPGEDAIKRAFEIYVEDVNDEIKLNVKDVYIAYLIEAFPENGQAQAHPVWVININDEIIYLDVSELAPLKPGESDEYI